MKASGTCKQAWDSAVDEQDLDIWIEHLDRVDVSDHFSFLLARDALRIGFNEADFPTWIQHVNSLDDLSLFEALRDPTTDVQSRLAVVTYDRWINSIRRILTDPPVNGLPQQGVVQYFSDGLEFNVLLGFRRTGTTVEIRGLLAIPNPTAYADPILALRYARNTGQLELLRRSLYSRHKVLIQRNTLLHVDREASGDVFGPTIDTLLLNDWMFDERYLPQRTQANSYLFEETLTAAATTESLKHGTSLLEIGCGNGLLTATFARNEARISRIAAIDISMAAVGTTYRNAALQRHLHRGVIGDRGRFIAAQYDISAVPHTNDVVLCNPPYVPLPEDKKIVSQLHPMAKATLGTDLLCQVVRDAPTLVDSHGHLAIVMSELALPELEHSIPTGWSVEKQRSMRVPFRLETASETYAPEYVDWLVKNRGLTLSGTSQSPAYEHDISILLIKPLSD
ncbi:methyltransferase [Streptomyces sp. NBC_01231]|nr:methyltransferase [Streptomyces sp. NBC_01231]